MKRAFFKTLAVTMAVCILFLTVSAVEVDNTRISNSETEIVTYGINDKEKVQQIIDIINGEEIIVPYSILCIFGHNTARGRTEVLTHRHSPSAPRCLLTTYDTVYCTRTSCNYLVLTPISSGYIHCCP